MSNVASIVADIRLLYLILFFAGFSEKKLTSIEDVPTLDLKT